MSNWAPDPDVPCRKKAALSLRTPDGSGASRAALARMCSNVAALTSDEKKPSEKQLLAALSGHVCRCTGYQGIRRAAKKLAGPDLGDPS